MLQDLSLGCENHMRQADLIPLSGPKKQKKKKFSTARVEPQNPRSVK